MFSLLKKTPKTVNLKNLKHIAIIMDGNARFAKNNGLPLQIGHKMGVENIKNIVDYSLEISLPYLSLYAFSSENWRRSPQEVSYLMELLENYLDHQLNKLLEKNIKLLICGNLYKVSANLQQKIASIQFHIACVNFVMRLVQIQSLTLHTSCRHRSPSQIQAFANFILHQSYQSRFVS